MALQATHGTIAHVKGKGAAAAAVHRIMGRMRRELGQDAPGPAGACGSWACLGRGEMLQSTLAAGGQRGRCDAAGVGGGTKWKEAHTVHAALE